MANPAKIFLILCLLFNAISAQAAACLTKHIQAAIRSNETRAILYASQTGGESLRISRALIESEKISLPFAKIIDLQAQKFEDAGVPVVCSGLVSMNNVPEFGAMKVAPRRHVSGSFEGSRRLRLEIEGSFQTSGFPGVLAAVQNRLAQIQDKNFDCLQRHFLESIGKFATEAQAIDGVARSRGLGSTASLSWEVIHAHVLALSDVSRIDRLAIPLQERGIPILCQDLPPIDLE